MNMTSKELVLAIIAELPIKKIHPLHEAMLEECCENTINNKQNIIDEETLKMAASIAFITCNSTLKSTMKGALEYGNANQITLNYRNQTFIIPENSPLLNDE